RPPLFPYTTLFRSAGRDHVTQRREVFRLLVDVALEDADEGQVAVELAVIEAVPDDVLVGDLEADVLDVDADDTPVDLVEQRTDGQAGRLLNLQRAQHEVHRQAGVDDVLDQDDVLAANVEVQRALELDPAGGDVRAGDRQVVDRQRARDLSRRVGQEEGDALEPPDQHQRLASVVFRDLAAQLGDSLADLGGREEDALDVLGLERADVDRAVAEAPQQFVKGLAVHQG